jgi:hypothetical protein
MVTGSVRLGPMSDCTSNCRPVLSSERAPHRNKTTTFRQQPSDRKQYLVGSTREGSTPRYNYWPSVIKQLRLRHMHSDERQQTIDRNMTAACCYLAWFIHLPWRRRQYVPQKSQLNFNRLILIFYDSFISKSESLRFYKLICWLCIWHWRGLSNDKSSLTFY